jgi:DNA-binding transcriptional LysR family regulator
MELRQLRYFVAVAQELHFAHAAARLNIAQQSLSFQIKQLEDELGTPLFERTTRRVELTIAGQLFLKEVTAAFHHLQTGVENVQRVGRGEIGRLAVGYHSTSLYNIMPAIVRLFRERHPDVQLVLQEIPAPALESSILSGDIDLGISSLSDNPSPELAYEIVYRDRVAVALPKEHPLENCDGIALATLSAEPFVMYSRDQKQQAFDQIITLCQHAGFSPQIIQEAATESAVISLVAAGVGIAIVLMSLQMVRTDEVTYHPLIDPVMEVNFALLWRQQNSDPLVKAFFQTAQEVTQHKAEAG